MSGTCREEKPKTPINSKTNELDSVIQLIMKQKELTTQYCYVCGSDFEGVEPDRCCGGFQCGCMGMPTDPSQIVCSSECYDKLMKPDQYHNEPLPTREP